MQSGPDIDIRRYNRPTTSQVGALLIDNTEATHPRDVILHSRNGILQRISEIHPAYDPCQYPVLFPYGTFGWFPRCLRLRGVSKFVSLRDFVCFRLQVDSNN